MFEIGLTILQILATLCFSAWAAVLISWPLKFIYPPLAILAFIVGWPIICIGAWLQ